MLFNEYKIIKGKDWVKLYTEMVVQFECASDETICIGTPKWWDDFFLEKVDVEKYDIYFMCSHTISHGEYNCVTDYKKIWGLNEIDRGIYDNTYVNDQGKVYFGIVKGHGEMDFRSSKASTILLVPNGSSFSCDDIFNMLQKNGYDFNVPSNKKKEVLFEIQKRNKDSFLLNYVCGCETSLTMYGKGVEKIFSELDILKYNNCEDSIVYRKS